MNEVVLLVIKLLSGVVAALVSYFVINRAKTSLSSKPGSIHIKLNSGEERELKITPEMTSEEITEGIRKVVGRD